MPGASNSTTIYASASTKYGYTLSVSWNENATSSYNNTSVITASGSMGSSQMSFAAGSSYSYYLRLYWHDNKNNTDVLIASSSRFTSCGMSYGTRTVFGSITVTHKSDGTLSGYVKCVFDNVNGATSGGYAPTTKSVQTSSQALTNLGGGSSGGGGGSGGTGNKSTITLSGSTRLGGAVTVNINAESPSYYHTVMYDFAGSGYYTTVGTNVKNTFTFTPAASLAQKIPNSSYGTLTIRVRTYDEDDYNLGYVNETRTMYVSESTVPTIGEFTATRIDNGIPADWGLYVQNFSKCQLDLASSSGIYGSTISRVEITGNNINTIDYVSSISRTTDVLTVPGRNVFTCKVTDSRGMTATKTVEINVEEAGAGPTVIVDAQRCDSDGTLNPGGSYVSVTVEYYLQSIGGKNSVKSMVATCNGVSVNNFASNVPFIIAANISAGSSYEVSASITDILDRTTTVTTKVSSDVRIMNIKQNKRGVAIGKFSEIDDTFEVGWDSMFHKAVHVTERISTDAGYEVISGSEELMNANRIDTHPMSSRFIDYSKMQVGTEIFGNCFEMVGGAYQSQLAISATGNLYIRSNNNGSWTSWEKLKKDDGSVVTVSDISNTYIRNNTNLYAQNTSGTNQRFLTMMSNNRMYIDYDGYGVYFGGKITVPAGTTAIQNTNGYNLIANSSGITYVGYNNNRDTRLYGSDGYVSVDDLYDLCSGSDSITTGGSGRVTIYFPHTMSSIPNVVVSAESGYPYTRMRTVTVGAISRSSFTIYIYTAYDATYNVYWMAYCA